MYDLPSQQSQVEQEKESVTNHGYFTQDEKVSRQHTQSDNSKIKMEKNPSYHCVSYNNFWTHWTVFSCSCSSYMAICLGLCLLILVATT